MIDHLNCTEFNRHADDLKLVMTVFAGTGYTISLILSLTFAVGFYRKNTKDLGRKDKNNIKKTMIACTVEILFDIALPIGLSFASFKWFSAALNYTANIHFNEALASVDIGCGIRVRLEALDGGMSKCILVFLLLQPVVQELVFFISLLVDYCRNNSSQLATRQCKVAKILLLKHSWHGCSFFSLDIDLKKRGLADCSKYLLLFDLACVSILLHKNGLRRYSYLKAERHIQNLKIRT